MSSYESAGPTEVGQDRRNVGPEPERPMHCFCVKCQEVQLISNAGSEIYCPRKIIVSNRTKNLYFPFKRVKR